MTLIFFSFIRRSSQKEGTIRKPDLVLVDLYMKGSDRWDVLMPIKGHYPLLPVIILTGSIIIETIPGWRWLVMY